MQAYSVQTYSVQAYSVDASAVPGLEDGDAAEACLLQEDVDHPRGLVRSSRGGLPVDPHLRLPPGGADVVGVLCLRGRVSGVLGSSRGSRCPVISPLSKAVGPLSLPSRQSFSLVSCPCGVEYLISISFLTLVVQVSLSDETCQGDVNHGSLS